MADDADSIPTDGSADRTQGKDNLANLSADPGHQFDQTNGVVDGLDGDDDGTPDDDGTLIDPTLSDDATRQRPDEDNRLA